VSTGNIRNDELIELFRRRLGDIEQAFASASFVELHRDMLIVHGPDAPRGHALRHAITAKRRQMAGDREQRQSGVCRGQAPNQGCPRPDPKPCGAFQRVRGSSP